jgi:hypothetical protein
LIGIRNQALQRSRVEALRILAEETSIFGSIAQGADAQGSV